MHRQYPCLKMHTRHRPKQTSGDRSFYKYLAKTANDVIFKIQQKQKKFFAQHRFIIPYRTSTVVTSDDFWINSTESDFFLSEESFKLIHWIADFFCTLQQKCCCFFIQWIPVCTISRFNKRLTNNICRGVDLLWWLKKLHMPLPCTPKEHVFIGCQFIKRSSKYICVYYMRIRF